MSAPSEYLDGVIKNILDDGIIVYTSQPLNAYAKTALNDHNIRSLVDDGFISLTDIVNLIDDSIVALQTPSLQDNVRYRIENPLRLLQNPKVRELIRNGYLKDYPSFKQGLSYLSDSFLETLNHANVNYLLDNGFITVREIAEAFVRARKHPRPDTNINNLKIPVIFEHIKSGKITAQESLKISRALAEALSNPKIAELIDKGLITIEQICWAPDNFVPPEEGLAQIQPLLHSLLHLEAVQELLLAGKITAEEMLNIGKSADDAAVAAAAFQDEDILALLRKNIISPRELLNLSRNQYTELLKPQVRAQLEKGELKFSDIASSPVLVPTEMKGELKFSDIASGPVLVPTGMKAEEWHRLRQIKTPQQVAEENTAEQNNWGAIFWGLMYPSVTITQPLLTAFLGTQNPSAIGAEELQTETHPTEPTSWFSPQIALPLAATIGVCAATAVCFWKKNGSNTPQEQAEAQAGERPNSVPSNSH